MITKATLSAAGLGTLSGIIVLAIELTYSALSVDSGPQSSYEDSVPISYYSVNEPESLYKNTLAIFDVEDAQVSSNTSTDNLLSEDVTVRIVAQAKIGDTQNTILEIVSDSETKRIKVKEGSIVNGLMIKAITDEQLIVEKDAVEHSIKLFHPKELNLTKTEQDNDSL